MNRAGIAGPHLRLFGDAALVGGDGPVALPKLAFVLASFLALSNERAEVSRRHAASFLWPELPAALSNLRQLLARVRTERATDEAFEVSASHVRLRLEALTVDVIEFRTLITNLSFENAGELIALYRDGFLSSISRTTGPSDWIALQADGIRRTIVAALSDLIDRPEARANSNAAHAIATRLLDIDTTCEAAWRALMQFHATVGQPSRVEETYARCRTALRTEIDALPSTKTTELYQRLTRTYRPLASATFGGAPEATTAPETHEISAAVPRLVILPPTEGQPSQVLSTMAGLLIEDVVIGLCSMKSISLLAPHTSWCLRGELVEDDVTLNRLQIGYVVQTRIFGGGNQARLVAKLYETTSRSILWMESFPITARESQNTYRAISVGIILALADAIERNELARFDDEGKPSAYYWHLIGQKHLRGVDLPEARRATKAFATGIRADPEFAPAHSGYARALQRQWILLARGEEDLLTEARQSGLRASNLDHRDARGFREVARCLLYQRNFDESLDYYAQAERLSPQHADLVADYADALAHSGSPEDGLAKIKRALDLNPIPPEQYWWDAAGMYFQLGQYRKAIKTVSKMEHPTAGLRIAAASWALLGDKKKAEKCAATFLESYPDFRIEKWLALVPNRNPDDTRHYELGLRAAGFH